MRFARVLGVTRPTWTCFEYFRETDPALRERWERVALLSICCRVAGEVGLEGGVGARCESFPQFLVSLFVLWVIGFHNGRGGREMERSADLMW